MSGMEELTALLSSEPAVSCYADTEQWLAAQRRYNQRCTDWLHTHAPALLERIAALEADADWRAFVDAFVGEAALAELRRQFAALDAAREGTFKDDEVDED